MVPSVQQPASLMESSAARHQAIFAYQQILSYYRGELSDPHAFAAVEEQLRKDRRWQAHWDSIRYLDLERAAALQDAAELARFTAAQATDFCRGVAEYGGAKFDAIMDLGDRATSSVSQKWDQHVDQCPYCRRMRRLAYAQQQQREAGLPRGELLLRDWLLQPCYLDALREATRRLGFEWPATTHGDPPPSGGDTVVNQDTHFTSPPARQTEC
jgi:hypothetical protein